MTEHLDDQKDPNRRRFSIRTMAEEDLAADQAGPGPSPPVWQRRFGPELPERPTSGHWRHRDTDVARLRMVSDLVARGADPRDLMDLSLGELEMRAAQASFGSRRRAEVTELDTERAMRFIESYDADGLLDQLLEIGCTREACAFVEQDLGPLLVEIGRRWSTGELKVPQEHMATATIQSLLHQLKARMQSSLESKHVKSRVTVVLAGLPGERHELPLQMVAYVAELAGARCIVMGGDATAESIVRSATLAHADMVGIHLTTADACPVTESHLAELRGSLPESVALVVGGGAGYCEELPEGVTLMKSLSAFEALIEQLVDS